MSENMLQKTTNICTKHDERILKSQFEHLDYFINVYNGYKWRDAHIYYRGHFIEFTIEIYGPQIDASLIFKI